MTLITPEVLARAAVEVNGMSAAQKVQLADEIYLSQPNLLASVLVLPRFGVSPLQLEVPIHVLLVMHQAIKHSGHTLSVISEDVQDICMQRLTATVKFTEGLPPELVSQMMAKFSTEHPERYLLAFIYGYLSEHDLLSVRTEAEKFLLLASLNLVECIAFSSAHP